MLAFWITLFVQGCTLFGILWINYHDSGNNRDKTRYLIYLTVFSMVLIMILFETEPFGLKKILSTISGGHGGDWLQFWGTYLGIIFSVVLTLYVTNQQGQIDRENARTIHSIEIYIDNLMIALDVFIEISEFFHRCETNFKKAENHTTKNNQFDYDIELILLLRHFENDEILDKVFRLENVIKKMPFKTKQKLNMNIKSLILAAEMLNNNDYLAMYVDKAEMDEVAIEHLEEKYKQIVAAIDTFIKEAGFINNFVVLELDEYNKI